MDSRGRPGTAAMVSSPRTGRHAVSSRSTDGFTGAARVRVAPHPHPARVLRSLRMAVRAILPASSVHRRERSLRERAADLSLADLDLVQLRVQRLAGAVR